MKNKTKRKFIKVIAVVLALLMPMSTAAMFAVAGDSENGSETGGTSAIAEKYASPDINEISGQGEEPEELSVSAGATYQEKAWYEYVAYSEHAVSSYRVDDDHRILFYDPYTYTNSMIMDVQFDATTTEFDTMSSYTVSNTISNTISACAESTYNTSSATQTSGQDLYHTDVTNGGFTHTKYNYDEIHKTDGTVKEKTEYTYKSLIQKQVQTAFYSITAVRIIQQRKRILFH